MRYTEDLVQYIVEHRKDDLPEEVMEKVKLIILDTIGCGIGGYCTDLGKQVVSMAKRYQIPGEARLIGDGTKVCAEFACWANSSLANILDMDDVFAGTAHQANCLIPTAFGIGEVQNASGLEVIHAITLGFEVGSRIGLHAWPSPAKARTYFPSTWQVFNAVTAAGMLLGLNKKALYHAFGLAGTVPPIPIDMQKFVERPMGFAKNVFGWTTFTGVFWTRLAQMGSEGAHDILDGDAGFWTMMGSDEHDFKKLLEGLGEKFHLMDTKFKPYPLCTWGHTSVDAAKKIFEENPIQVENIESIKVKTLKRAVDFLSNPGMATIFDAQFSLPHAISMLALGKKPGPEWMNRDNIFHNPEAKAIARKVTMEVDPSAEQIFFEENGLAIPSHVEIRMEDGRIYQETVKYSKGTPNNPFTKEEVEDKFRTLASSLLDEKRIREIMNTVNGLEKLDNISLLTELLKKE
ncbi:MAG: MmgE/PrpD family protein [Pseudomonadota bacterium]